MGIIGRLTATESAVIIALELDRRKRICEIELACLYAGVTCDEWRSMHPMNRNYYIHRVHGVLDRLSRVALPCYDATASDGRRWWMMVGVPGPK